jgi:DNA-binding Xre family transcriptional regulator
MLHPKRREIVSKMIYGAKLTDLAREFSVSEDSLWRFKKTGLVELIAQEKLRSMANDLCKALLASEVESERLKEAAHGQKE